MPMTTNKSRPWVGEGRTTPSWLHDEAHAAHQHLVRPRLCRTRTRRTGTGAREKLEGDLKLGTNVRRTAVVILSSLALHIVSTEQMSPRIHVFCFEANKGSMSGESSAMFGSGCRRRCAFRSHEASHAWTRSILGSFKLVRRSVPCLYELGVLWRHFSTL